MPAAVLIARLIGPLFVVIGVGILLNGGFYAEVIKEAANFPTLIYLYGVLGLLAGLAVLNVHRAWTADWRVIVTVLGWLLVIGGIIRIVLPQLTATLAATIYTVPLTLTTIAVVICVVGGFLSFKAYRQA